MAMGQLEAEQILVALCSVCMFGTPRFVHVRPLFPVERIQEAVDVLFTGEGHFATTTLEERQFIRVPCVLTDEQAAVWFPNGPTKEPRVGFENMGKRALEWTAENLKVALPPDVFETMTREVLDAVRESEEKYRHLIPKLFGAEGTTDGPFHRIVAAYREEGFLPEEDQILITGLAQIHPDVVSSLLMTVLRGLRDASMTVAHGGTVTHVATSLLTEREADPEKMKTFVDRMREVMGALKALFD